MESTCKKIRNLLPSFVTGEIETVTGREIKNHIEGCRECKKEAEELGLVVELTGSMPEEIPPVSLKASFYEMLNEEKGKIEMKNPIYLPFWLQIAAGLVLLVAGMFTGSILFPQRGEVESQSEIAALQQDIKEMKQLVVYSLLRQESASERIKAVSYAMEFTEPERELTEALLNTLNYDPSVNVRLSAIQALSNFSYNGEIRSGLIESLEKQYDPMVQIMLINTLVGMAEKNAVHHFKRLAEDEETLDIVKQHAEEGIKTLI